jgi:AmmeMemoRadiSam system protein A
MPEREEDPGPVGIVAVGDRGGRGDGDDLDDRGDRDARDAEHDRELGEALVALAVAAVGEAVGALAPGGLPGGLSDLTLVRLAQPTACFVTLMRRGRLRGCIGSVVARRSLLADVRANARAAALSDPRFPPVAREELPELEIEVSVLTPPEPLAATTEDEALAALAPGLDGIIFEFREWQSTFLPQVWQQLPDRREFLDQLKEKAGLPRVCWSPEVRLQRYRVTKYTGGA